MKKVFTLMVVFVVMLAWFAGCNTTPLVSIDSTPEQGKQSEGNAKSIIMEPTEIVTMPIALADMSESAEELLINYRSINDPYIYNNELIFSTGEPQQSTPELNTIAIFNLNTEETVAVEGIVKKYNSIFEPELNDDYIVYLDCKPDDGGTVCGYDRNTKEMFLISEYLFNKPKVTLVGEYALWIQQTDQSLYELYLYHLPTRESTVIDNFASTAFSISAPYMSEDTIVYVRPEGESSESAKIVIMPIDESGNNQPT